MQMKKNDLVYILMSQIFVYFLEVEVWAPCKKQNIEFLKLEIDIYPDA